MSGRAFDSGVLPCPECGRDLIPASGRGRIDSEGEEQRHRPQCRCRWCGWWWVESDATYPCECGFVGRIYTDDGCAHVVEVE